jgi:hypothetical protein
MSRTEAIALITAKLASADDATLQSVADQLESAGKPRRDLSARERALLKQSREDFKAGRTYSLEECIAYLDEKLAPLGVPKYKKP